MQSPKYEENAQEHTGHDARSVNETVLPTTSSILKS